MAIIKKLDSNRTSLAFAAEVLGSPGELPVTPTWYGLEPNEYDDFGGDYTLLARQPINSSRQRKKGVLTDLSAAGGFNQDLTQYNSQRLLAGFMYAAMREKPTASVSAVSATGFVVPDESIFFANMLVFASGFTNPANNGLKLVTGVDGGTSEVEVAGLVAEGAPPAGAKIVMVGYQAAAGTLDVVTTGAFATITSTAGVDFTTLGLIPGEFIFVGGDAAGTFFPVNAANNGLKRLHSVAAGALVVDKSALPMVAEADGASTIRLFFGRVLKNELEDLQVKQSFQLERKLGAPDTAQPTQIQAEYIVGAFPNEFKMNVQRADKINCDFGFVATDKQDRVATVGIKAGNRPVTLEGDAYNTSTDFSGLRLALWNGADEAPTPLFAYITEMSLSINNNVSLDKAVGYLGGFDATLGIFEVSMELTAYFSRIEAVAAVRNNSDVTFHAFVAKNNAGFVWDLPLCALGGGKPDIKLNEAVKLPLTMDAATAVKLNPDMDYTCLWTFFDYLPSAAESLTV